MFFSKNTVEYLIVGLGNPGAKYDKTRHNVGFAALDYVAAKTGASVTRAKFKALTGQGTLAGKKVLLMKPQTYMNLSGQAVGEAAAFYKIPPQNCIIIFDDVALPLGKIRVREKGSAGGHNGVKSLIQHIGADFPRVKIGVGAKAHEEMDLADHVLAKFSPAERKLVEARHEDILGALELIVQGDAAGAMSRYNA